jgi:hypothetical protein
MTAAPPSMLDALKFGETHSSESIRQYAGWARKIFDWRGLGPEDLAAMPAEVAVYLELAPKHDRRRAMLVRSLIWKPGTYKQYQKGGRLLIEHFFRRAGRAPRPAGYRRRRMGATWRWRRAARGGRPLLAAAPARAREDPRAEPGPGDPVDGADRRGCPRAAPRRPVSSRVGQGGQGGGASR